MRYTSPLAAAALILAGIGTIEATPFNNNVGLIGVSITPSYTLSFDSAPGLTINSSITNQFSPLGISFGSPAFYDANSGGAACRFNGFDGDCIGNYASAPYYGITRAPSVPFSILFATPQSYAAFALVTDNNGSNNTLIQAFLGNTLVDQSYFTTGSSANQPTTVDNYYGFYDTSGFDRIVLTTSNQNLLLIDNLQVQSVPEPGTMAMLSLGLCGAIAFARYRWRSRSAS